MKNVNLIILTTILCMGFGSSQAQEKKRLSPFEKKFHAGISFNSYWTTITGSNLPREYFTKPSLGFNIRAEYYFKPFIGLGIGAGYQQAGTGIINPDYDNSLGDPDSTHLERLRFHTIEVPISLLLRTPNDVVKGIRLSGSIGIVPLKVFKSSDIFLNVSNGAHLITPVSDQYLTNDVMTQFTLGPEIDSGGTGLFQLHFVYSQGTKNVFAQNQGTGYNRTMGLRIAWLFGSNLHTKDNKKQ